MEPVSFIVGALTAGASAGLGDAAKSAVDDVYQRLKQALASRFTDPRSDEMVLAKYEGDPATWSIPMADAVARSGAGADTAVLHLARQLMSLVDPGGAELGKYDVTIVGGRNIQIGDGNTQFNVGW
jgi:hypothetical protein